jgi:exonuclease SbcC
MKFIQLKIQGFKSFGENQVLDFPSDPGLYFLTGKNECEPDLEANGSGKSSTFDAVCFSLYGKTPRNSKAGDICNWYADEKTVVSLKFEIKNQIYDLKRTWSPNSIVLNGKNVNQDELLSVIRLGFDDFLYSVLFSQFRPQFFDLSAAEKTTLFSSILNLEEWDEYSKRASNQVSHLGGIENDLKLEISHMKGMKESLKSLKFEEKIQNWEEKRQNTISGLETDIFVIQTDLELLKTSTLELLSEKNTFILDKTDFKDKLDEHNKDIQSICDDLKEIVKVEKQIDEDILDIKTQLGVYKSQILKFEKLGDNCPSCLQKVDPKHVEKELKIIKEEITTLLVKDNELQLEKQEAEDLKVDLILDKDLINEKKDEINSKILVIQRENNKKELLIAKVDAQVKINKTEVSKLLLTINKKNLEIEKLKEEENPVLIEQQTTKNQIKILTSEILQKANESLTLAGTIEQTAFWVKGFRNIRLFLISEVLTQLELESNNVLFRLGLRDWSISFDIDRENKSGTIRKGFSVLITSPYNDSPVAWESWSGGETQRLKLASTIGLSNLILARCGIDSFVEVYDEASNWLSTKGVEQLVECLDNRSQELDRQIWMIDHRSLESSSFKGVYSVNKNESGSYFEHII